MAAQEDFIYGDDLDALLAAIDADVLENDTDFDLDMNSIVEEIPEDSVKSMFSCSLCPKVCISKGGLSRHTNAKHKDINTDINQPNQPKKSSKDKKEAEEVMHPLYFKKYLEECIVKLANDECYPAEEVMHEFKIFRIGSLDDVIYTYNIVRDVIQSFNGDAEKFYPLFYKRISETEKAFKNELSKTCSLLLGFEVANHVLCHLTGSSIKNNILEFAEKSHEFTEKEKSIICYLSGYVFSTFYRRVRFSNKKSSDNIYHQQYLSLLLAGKVSEGGADMPEHKLIDARNRGGLWKVTKEVISIFTSAESLFHSFVIKNYNKIDSKEMVSCLMKDCGVLSNFSKIRNLATDSESKEVSVKKEVYLNLLQDLLMLYIRVRSFSFVKDKQQLHKMNYATKKSRSLRTEIKKSSSCLDQGH